MDKVISFSLSDNFIECLADLVEKEFLKKDGDLSRICFVFGGKRPALFLKKELSKRIKKCFFPPQFFTIDEFIEYALAKNERFTKIRDLDACYLIYSLAREVSPKVLAGRSSFSEFLPWAREVLSFIEQLDLEAIQEVSLKNVELKAQIGYDIPENINALLQDIVGLRQVFHKRLIKNKTYSRGLLYLLASEKAREMDFSEFQQIIFANFFYLHKTEEEVFRVLMNKDKAYLVFQGQSRDWSVLDKLAKSLGVDIDSPQENPGYKLNILAGFDQHSQAGAVRQIIQKVKDPDKTVIVLPDPQAVIPLVSEISCFVEEFNISMGYPLKRSSLYAVFTSIFKAQETRNNQNYYARDYLKVLSHPLIKNLKIIRNNPNATRALIHKIEEALTGIIETDLAGSLFVSLKGIESCRRLFDFTLITTKSMDVDVTYNELKALLTQVHELLFTSWENVGNFSEFSARLDGFMQVLVEKSFLDNYPLNLKMAERVFDIKDELELSSFRNEPFKLEDIFKIFDNKLENEMISFSGSPLKGLQILGLLETRALNFENVIIMDVNEAVFPKLNIYEPLIPREIMISLGLNRLEKDEEIQRYQFRRLIAQAKNVYLVYAQNDESEKSRFIEELIWEKQKKENKLDVLAESKVRFNVRVLPERLQIKKNKKVLRFLENDRYSASSLDTYLHCPLRFYYQYVLDLEEKEDLLQEPEARDVGNFLHELLEEVFAKFIHKKPVLDEKFETGLFNLFEDKFSQDFARKMRSDSFLLKEIIMYRLKNFVQNERKREIKQIISLEKKIEDRIALSRYSLRIKARVDRIDRLADNSILVIDYKTGSADILPDDAVKIKNDGFSRQALKERMKSFQLPIYLLLVDMLYPKERTNACLYSLRDFKNELGLKMLFKKEEHFRNKEEIIAVYKQALESIIEEILDPSGVFKADDSSEHYCGLCPFFYLCR
ncbi:MAG: PD-(D/E)XK nuclease family protein [Candidatus Omnitrophota bacterium]